MQIMSITILLLLTISSSSACQTSVEKDRMKGIVTTVLKDNLHDPYSYKQAKWHFSEGFRKQTEEIPLNQPVLSLTSMDSLLIKKSAESAIQHVMSLDKSLPQIASHADWMRIRNAEITHENAKELKLLVIAILDTISKRPSQVEHYNVIIRDLTIIENIRPTVASTRIVVHHIPEFYVYHKYRAKNLMGAYKIGELKATFSKYTLEMIDIEEINN